MAHHYDNKLERKDAFYKILLRIITGSLIFIATYILVIAFFQVVTSYVYNYFFITATVNYNIIDDVPQEYLFWNLKRITFINSFGPITIFFLAIISRYIFNAYLGHVNLIRYYVLWMYVLCMNYFLALLMSSPFGVEYYNNGLYQGFNVVFAWMRMKSVIISPLAIASALGLLLFGYNIGNLFLKFSFSFKNNSVKKGRNIFITQSFVLPFIFGAPVVLMLASSYSFVLNVFLLIGLALIAIGMYLRNEYVVVSEKATKSDILNKIPIIELIIAASLWSFIFFLWS